MSTTSQTARILAYFKANPHKCIPMPELSRIGSGSDNGWCASFTKRIHECRALVDGEIKMTIEHREESKHTFYQYIPRV